MPVTLENADMREALARMAANGVRFDACACDPPYHLASIVRRFGANGAAPAKSGGATGVYARSSKGFMGKQWDGGDIAFRAETWALVGSVLKPGAHLVAFGAAKNAHRMTCAIEDAGFEIRDQLQWMFASGFPKSHQSAIKFEQELCERRDLADGTRQWLYKTDGEVMTAVPPFRSAEANEWWGYGTALKPAFEPIILARWPMSGASVIENIRAHGTGAMNIDAARVGTEGGAPSQRNAGKSNGIYDNGLNGGWGKAVPGLGRWPANVAVEDGINLDGAERFFFSAKADAGDRLDSKHPTVKPVDLMRWLLRLVVPKGGHVLDCFAGSGTTGMAALAEGFDATLIEREAEYAADIRRRIAHVSGADTPLFAAD